MHEQQAAGEGEMKLITGTGTRGSKTGTNKKFNK